MKPHMGVRRVFAGKIRHPRSHHALAFHVPSLLFSSTLKLKGEWHKSLLMYHDATPARRIDEGDCTDTVTLMNSVIITSVCNEVGRSNVS